MFIDRLMAQKIVDRSMKVTGHNVNVMNQQGVIIGSGLPERINQQHEGALQVLSKGLPVEIQDQQESTLHSVQQGINLPVCLNGQIIGVVGITGEPGQVRKYADLVVMTAELVVEQALLTAQVQWDQRQRELMLLRLVDTGWEQDLLFQDRVSNIGLDLSSPVMAIALQLVGDDGHDLSLDLMQETIQRLESEFTRDFIAIAGPGLLLLLHPVNRIVGDGTVQVPDALLEQYRACCHQNKVRVLMVCGQCCDNAFSLHESWQSATQAIKAIRATSGSRFSEGCFTVSDMALDILLLEGMNHPAAEQLIQAVQTLREKDKNTVLEKTLDCFFSSDADFSTTTDRLNIHRNTLRYRLDRIHEITGLNLRQLDQLVKFYVAYRLVKLTEGV